jgi:hypothetical protein
MRRHGQEILETIRKSIKSLETPEPTADLLSISNRQLVEAMAEEIREKRRFGFSWDAISEKFREGGVELSPLTIKTYLPAANPRKPNGGPPAPEDPGVPAPPPDKGAREEAPVAPKTPPAEAGQGAATGAPAASADRPPKSPRSTGPSPAAKAALERLADADADEAPAALEGSSPSLSLPPRMTSL